MDNHRNSQDQFGALVARNKWRVIDRFPKGTKGFFTAVSMDNPLELRR